MTGNTISNLKSQISDDRSSLGQHSALRIPHSALAVRRLLPAACCLLFLGCSERLETEYGARSGVRAIESVNGVSVLGDMFKGAGHRVGSWSRLSPALYQRADVIVWFPRDCEPPSDEAVEWLEDWLLETPGRTLVYVGRDFDAAPGYWKQVAVGAPVSTSAELATRQSEAQSQFATDRVTLPADEDWTWFTMQGTLKHRDVRTLSGSPDWLAGVDPAKVEIELNGRLVPPDTDFDDTDVEVLLESEGDLLVGRLEFDGSQLLVVANGSFLLNLPLVNREHRKLAAALIREVDFPRDEDATAPERRNVLFLETGGSPTVSDDDPEAKMPNSLALFGVAPLNQILLHLAVAGIIFCFARAPIFGQPRESPGGELADFGQHVTALGTLLAMTGNHQYATARLQQYQQKVRHEAATPRTATLVPSTLVQQGPVVEAPPAIAAPDVVTTPQQTPPPPDGTA